MDGRTNERRPKRKTSEIRTQASNDPSENSFFSKDLQKNNLHSPNGVTHNQIGRGDSTLKSSFNRAKSRTFPREEINNDNLHVERPDHHCGDDLVTIHTVPTRVNKL